jgi:dTDP-4-dehydrorhamnose reductase
VDVPGTVSVPWAPGEEELLKDAFAETNPKIVVYAAGLTNVDLCESHEQLANALHADAPATLAKWMTSRGARFVYISTDHLWNGTRSMTVEDEPPQPINAYARSKARGERLIRAVDASALILRTNFFGVGRPWRLSFSDWLLERLKTGQTIHAFSDSYFTPIALSLLYGIIVDAIDARLSGVYNACGSERLSKYEFAVRLAQWRGLAPDQIRRGLIAEAGLRAPRPADMSLSTLKLSKALGRRQPSVACSFSATFGPSTSAVGSAGGKVGKT